jgi:hypothetical protein
MMKSDQYEKNLAANGFGVGSIDYVMCTHLHGDHVGWNTRLDNGRWVPTFPKAKYLFADRELEFWTQKEKEDAAKVPWMTDSVLPIVAAGRHEIVKSDHALGDLVKLRRLRRRAGGSIPTRGVRAIRRHIDANVYGALPLAIGRPPDAVGGGIQVHIRVGQISQTGSAPANDGRTRASHA